MANRDPAIAPELGMNSRAIMGEEGLLRIKRDLTGVVQSGWDHYDELGEINGPQAYAHLGWLLVEMGNYFLDCSLDLRNSPRKIGTNPVHDPPLQDGGTVIPNNPHLVGNRLGSRVIMGNSGSGKSGGIESLGTTLANYDFAERGVICLAEAHEVFWGARGHDTAARELVAKNPDLTRFSQVAWFYRA